MKFGVITQPLISSWKESLAIVGHAVCVHPQCRLCFLSLAGNIKEGRSKHELSCNVQFKKYRSKTDSLAKVCIRCRHGESPQELLRLEQPRRFHPLHSLWRKVQAVSLDPDPQREVPQQSVQQHQHQPEQR